MKIRIGIVDDHQLFLKSLASLLETFPAYEIVLEALSGTTLFSALGRIEASPDILLLDVNLPQMSGSVIASKVNVEYPGIKLVALSQNDDDISVINMIKAGCCAYLLKDIHPTDLDKALNQVFLKGYYNGDMANINYRRLIAKNNETEVILNNRELTFLKLACSDLTYKQIASEMNLSERTIDGYREAIFEKFNVQSRVGMAMEAVRRKLVSLSV